MSVRERMSVFRWRQDSAMAPTLRGQVAFDKSDQLGGVRVRRQAPARMVELPARSSVVAGLVLVPSGGKVMEAADQLGVLTGDVEHIGQSLRSGEVLPSLEMTLGAPDRGANAGFWRWPLLLHARTVLESEKQ